MKKYFLIALISMIGLGRAAAQTTHNEFTNKIEFPIQSFSQSLPAEEAPDETKETTNDEPNFNDYGGYVGLGIAIGGGGLLGIPVRAYPIRQVAIELGYYFRPSIIEVESYGPTDIDADLQIKMPPFIAGGVDLFLGEKYNSISKKIVKNGLMLRVGTTAGAKYHGTYRTNYWSKRIEADFPFSQKMFAFGWARERFKIGNKKSSYVFNLGLGFIKNNNIPSGMSILLDEESIKIDPLIYWKFHWNFYLK